MLALADNINMVFKQVTSHLQPLLPAAASADHGVPDEFIISVTDCQQKLSKLCVHTAMGPDDTPNWIIKDSSYFLASPIAAIYHSSVRQSYMPPSWKQSEILHIPKTSQVTSMAKTYAISLSTQYCTRCWSSFSCPVRGKQKCTVKFSTAASNTAPPPLQSSRCYTMCFNVGRERTPMHVFCLLINFSKAFDHIDHNMLLDKLKTNGVPQICVDWQNAF